MYVLSHHLFPSTTVGNRFGMLLRQRYMVSSCVFSSCKLVSTRFPKFRGVHMRTSAGPTRGVDQLLCLLADKSACKNYFLFQVRCWKRFSCQLDWCSALRLLIAICKSALEIVSIVICGTGAISTLSDIVVKEFFTMSSFNICRS